MNHASEQAVVLLIKNGFVDNKYSPLVRQDGNKQFDNPVVEDSLIT